MNLYMIYRTAPILQANDISFIYSNGSLNEICKMIDLENWNVEQFYMPSNETIYAIYPEWMSKSSDVTVISCPDELFDHEKYIAKHLCEDKKLIKYINSKSEKGMLGVFYSAKCVFGEMVEFFRERPDYLIKYYDYTHKNKRKTKNNPEDLFDQDFYFYCTKQLLKRKDWFVVDVKRLN